MQYVPAMVGPLLGKIIPAPQAAVRALLLEGQRIHNIDHNQEGIVIQSLIGSQTSAYPFGNITLKCCNLNHWRNLSSPFVANRLDDKHYITRDDFISNG